ncbi:sensor histidine kinase [Hominibacterium faecale]|uniref:sensor histidine kinase n=1 Tax=Hominibacterium faecale TaxID=2839743 RepID=UPI001D1039ED|nr:HAMP domain-containing sensor histidine kinase [Hominibacterium faecale]MCC2864624.1 HAMP domain-containing histidine kinase [Anaerovorax odorimutans]
MNKNKAKRSFVIRAVTAVVAIYVLIVGSVTYYGAKRNVMEGTTYSWGVIGNLINELNGCRSSASSKGVQDGMNLAKATSAISRNDWNLGIWDASGRTDSLILFRAQKDPKGNVIGMKMVSSNASVLSNNSFPDDSDKKRVILDDWFSPQQIQEISECCYLEASAEVRGYDTEEFFEPVSLQILYTGDEEGSALKKKDFIPVKKPDGNKLTTLKFEEVSVSPIDTTARQEQDETWRVLVKSAVDARIDQAELGEDGSTYIPLQEEDKSILRSESVCVTKLAAGDYFLGWSIVDHPLSKTIASTLWLYFIMAIICTAACLVLVGSYCRTIDGEYEAESKRRKMSDAMAHEMKTPLGIIKNYSEALLEEGDEQKRKQYLNTIIEETDSMNEMVVSMLDLSKMEAGTYPMELSMISMAGITEKVIERTRILAKNKQLEVELKADDERQILADEKLVTQSICNLLINAITHAEEGSRIRIVIEKEPQGMRFTIHNQGQQIDDKEQVRIWDSFYRGDSARNRSSGGTGLGLAIVRNTSLIHRGTCGCENEEGGVAFWIRIPDQEAGQTKQTGKIGPILHTADIGLNLKGLLYSMAGTGIWLLLNGFIFIWKRYEYQYDGALLLIPWIITIPAWVVCWLGARKLKFLADKTIPITASIAVIFAGIAASCFLTSDMMDVQLLLLLQVVLCLMTVCVVIYLLSMSSICKRLAEKAKEDGLKKIITLTGAAEAVVLVLWAASRDLVWQIPILSRLDNVISGVVFIVILGNLYLWYHLYRRFHGKEI